MSEHASPNPSNNDPIVARIAELLAKGKESTSEVYGDTDDEFVIKVAELTEHFNLHPQRVLYPGSSQHAGVARVFGKDKVVHVDPDANAIAVMAKEGYQTQAGKVEEYESDQQFDLIVSFNAGTVEPNEIERLLTPSGYVIANNWHGSANRMSSYDNFRLLGAVLPSYHDGTIVDGATAANGLGVTRMAVTPGGEIALSEDIDETTMTVIENENSPDGLFLFQRQEEPLSS